MTLRALLYTRQGRQHITAPQSLTGSLALRRRGQRCCATAARGNSDGVGKSRGCWHLGSARVDANRCLAVLAASGLPLTLREAAPSYAGKLHLPPGCSFQQLPHAESLRLVGSCWEWAASCDCGGVGLLPLLLHRPSGLCQLFQVFPPTSCLHLLGIPVPAACPAIKQHVLRARCQGPAVPPLRRWDPLPGSQHRFLPPAQ